MNTSCYLCLNLLVVGLMVVRGFHVPSASPRYTSTTSRFTSMNMFNRFTRVVTSNINNIIKGLEDPEKVIEQAVIDMQSDLVKIRQSYAEVSATQKRMIKQRDQAQSVADDWYKRAQLALEKGDEELAREALARRQTQLSSVESMVSQINLQTRSIDKLYDSMTMLEKKIAEAKRQKDTFIARARTAKTSVQVNDMLSSLTGSNSMEAFERMKSKVENLEAEAEVAGELAASNAGTTVDLEQRFRMLEGDSRVDDELAAMKRQLPSASGSSSSGGVGTRSVKGELKSGSAQSPMVAQMSPEKIAELDLEYERLKKQFNK